MRARPLRGAFLLLSILWAVGAQARTCTISSGGIAFLPYNPIAALNVTTISSVFVQCNGRFQAVLSLNVGNGAGASFAGGRRMTRVGGGGSLAYNLYADSGLSVVLGNGTGGSVTLQLNGNNRFTQSVWAKIPGGQSAVRPGTYNDTVVATITY
jgi:spore coat protein U-like protein